MSEKRREGGAGTKELLMRTMATSVEQIKERLSITDLVASYITLEKSGGNFKARCPFHNEKTPSFYISPDRGSYYCFGCGEKGDIFTFVEKFEGLDFKGALRVLAERTGVALVYDKREKDDKDELFQVLEAATSYFEKELASDVAAKAYVEKRGVTKETIEKFRIGFAKDEWRGLRDALVKKGFKDDVIEKAGLTKKTEKGFYDRFRNRIIFPITDSSGRTIAFSGRSLVSDENTPKYLNSPETPVFKKSAALFGIQFAKGDIRKRNYAILVEGQFDLVLLHQFGFGNAVASSGTAVTESDAGAPSLLSTLGRFSNNLMLCFDGDKAGIAASVRTAKIALPLGMDVKVAKLPLGLDPADALTQDPKLVTSALKSATHIVYFLTDYLKETVADDRIRIRHVRERVLPLVTIVKSAIEREELVRGLSKILGVKESALQEDLSHTEKSISRPSETLRETKHHEALSSLERGIEKAFGLLSLLSEKSPERVGEMEQRLKDVVGEGEYEKARAALAARAGELTFEAELVYGNEAIQKHLTDVCSSIEAHLLRIRAESLLEKIREKESSGDVPDELLKEYDELSKNLERIKKSRLVEN